MASFYSASQSLQLVSQLTGQVIAPQGSAATLFLLPGTQGLPGIPGHDGAAVIAVKLASTVTGTLSGAVDGTNQHFSLPEPAAHIVDVQCNGVGNQTFTALSSTVIAVIPAPGAGWAVAALYQI